MQVMYGELHEQITQPVQAIVPDTERYWSPEAETASVYPIVDHDYHDPIMRMVRSALEESQEDNPNDSVITQMRLNISPPEEYSGSSDLKVYKMFVAGILWWLRLHGLLGVKNTKTQAQFLGTRLKGNASEWFTRNVEQPNRPIRDWSLESVIEGLQKQFLNLLTHRQVSNKFDTIKQGQRTVQVLIQELTKYAAQMVQYLDDYSFRRQLIAALWPSLQKEVLLRGITVEFSSMQDILEKVKDIKDSLQYDIGSQMSIEAMHNNAYTNQSVAKSSKWMIEVAPKGTTGQTMMNRQVIQPIQKTSSNTRKIPETTGKQPLKEGELKCYECGQKGHMWPQCPKLRSQCIAVAREDNSEEIVENIKGNLEEDAKSGASEGENPPKEEENLNESSGEDKEMYLWDELKYKVNYVRFISNKSTEQQVWIASAIVNKLEEPVYDHRTRIRERSRPLWKHNDNQPISTFWEIGGTKAHCLIDSGCKGIMISPNFIRAAKIEPFPLDNQLEYNWQ